MEKPKSSQAEQIEINFVSRSYEELERSIKEKDGVNLTQEEKDYLLMKQREKEREENRKETPSFYRQTSRKIFPPKGSRKDRIH